jgi:hypothetical protein
MKIFAGLLSGLTIVMFAATSVLSAEIPVDDRDLFTHLFTQKTIPKEWISEPANEELTPAMMAEIAQRLSTSGGKYQQATKAAKGWNLDFENGTARARIIRASSDNKLIGVFFSKLE